LSSFQEKKSDDKDDAHSPQQRLEKVWALLQMPESQKLDMAIKYSSDQHHSQLNDVSAAQCG
jgi:hypothetical protein